MKIPSLSLRMPKLTNPLKHEKKSIRYCWYFIALIGIVLIAFWVRSFPAKYNELQALDPFYIYRMSEYVLTHDWRLPEHDWMRYYPTGTNPLEVDYLMPVYFPAVMYKILNSFIAMPYLKFAIIYPAIVGALIVLVMFFIGKELFGYKAGLFSSFFLATVPAAITRTSAGFFEKESVGGLFIALTIYFFIRAYKRKSPISGILAGISFGLMSISWGGGQFIYLLLAIFTILILLFNRDVDKLMCSFAPMTVLGLFISHMVPYHINIYSTAGMSIVLALLLLLVRYATERFNLIKKEQLTYFTPSLILLAFVGVLIGSMFSDTLYGFVMGVGTILKLRQGVIGSTVAEQSPGDWSAIFGVTGTQYASSAMPTLSFISGYFALYIFMSFGLFLLFYRVYKTRDWILLLPIIWFFSSIWAVFYMIRLVYILGFSSALLSGYLFYELFRYARKIEIKKPNLSIKLGFLNEKMGILSLIVIIITLITIIIHTSNAYTYGNGLGPSICFPKDKPCLIINPDNSYNFTEGQPWYEAMDYLRTNTSINDSILSWWDFGYWFQTRGERASVADGGNINGTVNYELAEWFTDKPEHWNNWTKWLKYHKVGVILMDYTLPGKYGAISKIASRGEQIVGMFQFRRNQVYPQGNKTIYEFVSGPYAVWIPMEGDRIAGTPMFLITQNGQYVQKSYINDMCTTNGIITVGNETPSIKGCIALSNLGVYYVPPEAEHTIFTTLMFMDGYGLPVEKVFDNVLIKIYKVKYE
jgi:dolichyl-diphosphooligosaccharide--protein glycosyltransferase